MNHAQAKSDPGKRSDVTDCLAFLNYADDAHRPKSVMLFLLPVYLIDNQNFEFVYSSALSLSIRSFSHSLCNHPKTELKAPLQQALCFWAPDVEPGAASGSELN